MKMKALKKVYWTDGVNQMRFINVANYDSSYNNTSFDFSPIMELQETVSVEKQLNSIGQFPAGTVQYVCTYFNKNGVETNPFFVSSQYYSSPAKKGGSPESSFSNSFKLEMTNLQGSFDYARIYSIMRTSIDATPVVKKVVDIPIEITGSETVTIGTVENYHGVELTLTENITIYKYTTTWEVISLEDLQTMSFVVGDQIRFQGNFNIEITHKAQDSTFSEWEVPSGLMSLTLNFYDDSSSPGDLAITIGIDGDSYVYAFDTSFEALNLKIFDVDDVRSIVYIDTNTFGEVVQSMVPLYLGSTKVTGGTLAHKDNVLFIGNINLQVPTIGNKNINFSGNVTYDQKFLYSEESLGIDYGYEPYSLAKSHSEISTFKGGEYYRFGIQAQHETGKWSEVIWITDKQNNIYPATVPQTLSYSVDIWGAQASMDLTISNVNALIALGFKKIRGVVVYPKVNERRIVAQGFLNPTLFNVQDKFNNSPSNIPSWFLRPMANIAVNNLLQNSVQTTGNWVEFRHNKPILQPRYVGQIASTELDGIDADTTGLPYLDAETTTPNDFVSKFKNKFFIDQSVLTFHSPDIEFDSQVQTLNNPNLNLQIIGVANLTSFKSDATIAVDSQSPNLELGAGIVECPDTGVANYSITNGYKQLLAAPLWKDQDDEGNFKYFWIFPWHNFNKGLENVTGEDRTKLKRKKYVQCKVQWF